MKRRLNIGFAAGRLSTLALAADRPQQIKAILFAMTALVLVWEVTSRTFAAFLANAAPDQALQIHSQQATALLNLAETKLGSLDDKSMLPVSRAQVIGETRRLAEQALWSDPLNAQTLRLLGQIADLDRDIPRASRFMRASARRSLHETAAVAWMMIKSAERREYAPAIRYADVLFRTQPVTGAEIAAPVLARLAENSDREAVTALKEILSQNPPWRGYFFEVLPESITDARTPLDLLMAVKQSSAPPTSGELRSYLNFLIDRKFFPLAYYTWLQFLPADQLGGAGFVFNGGFESKLSGAPFDWSIEQGTGGATVDIDTVPDGAGNRALFVGLENGRVDFGKVTQLIMLAPARYKLQATYKGTLIGQRGLRWRVTCVDGDATPIGESEMIKGTDSTAWKTIEFSFAVPGADCPAQFVHLDFDARMASEQFVSGAIWFDNVRISRTVASGK